jgi:RNA polymerase sigma-70 factor, ECF subfamily
VFEAGQLALINGDLGLYNAHVETGGEWPEIQPRIQALTVRDGRVCAIWDVANPAKFTASPLGGQERSG